MAKRTQPGSEALVRQAAGNAAAVNISANKPKTILENPRLQPEENRGPDAFFRSDFEYRKEVDIKELRCFSPLPAALIELKSSVYGAIESAVGNSKLTLFGRRLLS
ncbi:MAG TPA: hypothetical protein VJ323_16385 [Bryobacteraceae bacterium]|jgi:hypothetical protein|nr:hypothetical protein [Bryobacteraceae bacterium]